MIIRFKASSLTRVVHGQARVESESTSVPGNVDPDSIAVQSMLGDGIIEKDEYYFN